MTECLYEKKQSKIDNRSNRRNGFFGWYRVLSASVKSCQRNPISETGDVPHVMELKPLCLYQWAKKEYENTHIHVYSMAFLQSFFIYAHLKGHGKVYCWFEVSCGRYFDTNHQTVTGFSSSEWAGDIIENKYKKKVINPLINTCSTASTPTSSAPLSTLH